MDTYEKIGYSILGVDAIVAMRFTTSPVMQGSAELLAYGTAVKIKRRDIVL